MPGLIAPLDKYTKKNLTFVLCRHYLVVFEQFYVVLFFIENGCQVAERLRVSSKFSNFLN